MESEELAEIKNMCCNVSSEHPKNVNIYCDVLHTLSVYIARSGVLLAKAKKELNDGVANVYATKYDVIKTLPASQVKVFINSQLSDENYLVDVLDRLNASCVHQSENLRTLISYAKEEMKMI